MKKLLVLTLVLGLSSAANAAFDIAVSLVDDYFDVTVTCDADEPDGYFALGITEGGTLSDVAIGPDAPSMSDIWGPIVPDLSAYLPGLTGWYGVFASAAGEVKTPGIWLTADAHIDSIAWVYLYSFDEAMNFTVEVPEPTTMALLGLGALLLRRHRK